MYFLLLPDDREIYVDDGFMPPEGTSVQIGKEFYTVKEAYYRVVGVDDRENVVQLWLELKCLTPGAWSKSTETSAESATSSS